MKKQVLATIVTGAVGACSQAFAQSSVTLYGAIDNSIQYTHNDDGYASQVKLQSGQFSVSKWGLRGSEDLGNGLKTVFVLENGFNANTGSMSKGLLFGRKAFVGLKSDNLGTLTVGRQYDALADLVFSIQGNAYLYYFTAPGDVDNADGSIHVSNSIKWTSPNWSGFQAVSMYSFGGVAGSTGSGQSYSGALAYQRGPLKLAAGYFHSDNGNPTLSTRGTTSAGGNFISVVNSAYSSASAINIARAGASYVIGPVTIGGYYSYSEYIADGASTFRNAERFSNGSVYALWQATPYAQMQVGYDYLKSHGDSAATYNQVTLAGDYSLSKRTDLYASFGYGHASGKNGFGSAQAVISDTYADAGGSTQEIVMLGIRHRF
ncbi:porin [Caballeronia sordidicola]|jgi:predicted porin|uniref:Outer membrane protein (Porin) n=1 Tax=Caballeronia sordidicola TaxID=196367 RepID=A0A226WKQ2_CABSO|nr:porin [Caballeronia sordidicola]OXC71771.1 Outer membrane protein (porin) [Caballeronia sordidicola]